MTIILTNSEAWYGLTKANIEQLEQVDEMLLRRVLEVGSCCPKEMLYLETGATPMRFTLIQRRLMFLHYILNEDKNSIIYKCFEAQKKNPCRNDWINTVEEDLANLDIGLSFDDIQTLSKYQWQQFLSQIIEERALEYLNKLKLSHSKVELVEHKSLELQEYFQPQNVESIQLSKFLFQARTRMLELKCNLKSKYSKKNLQCPLKCNLEDSQKHLLLCEKLEVNLITSQLPQYDDIYSENVDKQLKVGKILEERYRRRRKLLSSGPRVNQLNVFSST